MPNTVHDFDLYDVHEVTDYRSGAEPVPAAETPFHPADYDEANSPLGDVEIPVVPLERSVGTVVSIPRYAGS